MKNKLIFENIKPILHMRERIKQKRFGLVFGAGTSQMLDFPSWNALLDKLNSSSECISNGEVPSQTSRGQCHFQYFSNSYLKEHDIEHYPTIDQCTDINKSWKTKVINALYEKVSEDISKIKEQDKYLHKLLPIILSTNLTVNYNFDDTVQRLLNDHFDKDRSDTERTYRTDWKSDPQIASTHSVIYHPNGYLPKFTQEKPSDHLVLLSDAFGDQLSESMSGKYTYLINHYAQNTCLFIGLSLDDPTLQNMLRRNATIHPGHVHYYIHYISNNCALSSEARNVIASANFETYNLVTLFLNDKEIAELANYIDMNEEDFSALCKKENINEKYVYYVTGCVAAGKTTTVSFFRSLTIHDEWNSTMPKGMNADPSLAINEQSAIDNFVANQWKEKNKKIKNLTGIIIVDRCQLDAFGFTDCKKWKDKAEFLYSTICPDSNYELQEGMIFLLKNTPKELALRAKIGFRETNEILLEDQQKKLLHCYGSETGIVQIDCEQRTKQEVVKIICRIIHMQPYTEYDMHGKFSKIMKGDLQC